jgi:hypothetical protein
LFSAGQITSWNITCTTTCKKIMQKQQQRTLEAAWYALDLNRYTDPASFRVLSAHRQVVNLQVEGWPHLLIIAGPRLERGPAAAGLNGPDFMALRRYLRPGAVGRFEPGLLRFNAPGQAPALAWRGRPALSFAPPEQLDGDPAQIRAALQSYLQWLPRAGVDSASSVLFDLPGGEPYFREAMRDALPPLIYALLAKNQQDFTKFCRSLIGLGRGATPAGDDLVYGALIAGRWHAILRREVWQEPRFPEGFAGKTTILGRHMLEMGRRGLAAEPVSEFMFSLLQNSPSFALLQRIARIGSSSGYDIAAAVLYFMMQTIAFCPVPRESI